MTNVVDIRPKINKETIKKRLQELKEDRLELAQRFTQVRQELEDIRMLLSAIDHEVRQLTQDYNNEYI